MEKAKDDMIFEMGTEINLALIKAHYTDAKNRAANYKTFYEVCPSKLEVVEKLLPDGADGATIGQLHIVAQLIQMEDAHTDKTWFLALLGPKTKALYDAANALYARQTRGGIRPTNNCIVLVIIRITYSKWYEICSLILAFYFNTN
jgi:hypothetical protein